MFDYLLAGKKTGDVKMGVSLAASWAWGVSIVVGMQIFQEKGLAAFVIWAGGNSLALLLFGALALRVKSGITLRDVTGSKPIYWFAFMIQFFSVLANLTALKIAAYVLGFPPILFIACACVVVISYAWWGGLKASIETDLLQFAIWMILLLAALLLSKGRDGEVVLVSGNIGWASWGALTLIAAPFLDQQLWQRRFALKKDSLKSFGIGSLCFAVYMVLVAMAAFYRVGGVVIGLVILMVAMSTLDSAFMSIACYARGSRRRGCLLALVVFIVAFACLMLDIGLLNLWTFYSSLRMPVAMFVIYKILRR